MYPARWIIPHVNIIKAPNETAKNNLIIFLLNRFLDRYAMKKEAKIIPYKKPKVGDII